MLTVSSGYQSANKSNAVNSNGRISVYDTDDLSTTVFGNDVLGLIEISATTYRNGYIIGNLCMHDIKIEMYGDTSVDFSLNSEKHITPSFGMLVSGVYEWITYQKFLVTEVQYDDTTRRTTVRGVDFMYKLNKEIVDTNTYPMTLYGYATSVLTQCGLVMGNEGLINGAFSITSQPFVDYRLASEIISKVAELAGCFVMINKTSGEVQFVNAFPSTGYTYDELSNMTNDEIALLTYSELTGESIETFTKDNYFELIVKDHNFGVMGVNTLVMKISQVEGENDTVVNATNVAIDGNIEVQIVDNDIVNTSAKRLLVIDDLFATMDRFSFIPFIADYIGYAWLEVGDVVTFTDMNEHTFVTVITDIMIRYDGGMKGQLRGQTLNKVQNTYRNLSTTDRKIRRTELKVDKVAGEIYAYADNKISLEVGILNSPNLIPFSFETWEQGLINADGTLAGSTNFIRMKNFGISVASTKYEFKRSDGLSATIFWYDSSNVFISLNGITDGGVVTSPVGAVKFKVRMGFTGITLNDMVNYSVTMKKVETRVTGSKLEIDNTGASFYGDGVRFYDASNNLKIYFDTVLNRYVFVGELQSDTGKIGGMDISANGFKVTTTIDWSHFTSADETRLSEILAELVVPTAQELIDYDLNFDGSLSVNDLVIMGRVVDDIDPSNFTIDFEINSTEFRKFLSFKRSYESEPRTFINDTTIKTGELHANSVEVDTVITDNLVMGGEHLIQKGTWTPVVIGRTTAGTGTYTSQSGKYTKIGDMVYFTIFVAWTAHTGTGNLEVDLPFDNGNLFAPCNVVPVNLTYSNTLGAMVVLNEARVRLYTYSNGGGLGTVAIDTSASLYLSGSYKV